jgi:putative Mg2+ transporter-C (MgtC) family protein
MFFASLTRFAVTPSAGEVADFVGRAALALALGAVVGLERQWRQRMAGLRTNALVALGAALFELFSIAISNQHGADPTRIAAYVVSGVGFLGAGVIIRTGASVSGINTAATIWCSSAVGVLAGAGYVVEATLGAALIVLVHTILRPVGRLIDRRPAGEDSEMTSVYHFEAVCRAEDEAHVRALLVQAVTHGRFVLRAVRSEDLEGDRGLVRVEADLQGLGRDDVAIEAAVSRLSLEPGVTSVNWTVFEENGVVAAEL